MGAVYRARRDGLARDFALKLIGLYGPDSEERRARAHQEVVALAEFHHPHIVGLVDSFTVGPNQLAIVMDYVRSSPLSRQLASLEPASVMLILRQIASALSCVHDTGLIHRDIKPSNILVTWPMPNEPHAYMIDFGITHYSEAPSTTNGFIGSPAYASPEQVTGENVTVLTDIFSLGAIGYEAITGAAPFESDSVFDSLRRHSDWERPDLSAYYDTPYPAAFCKIIEGCLEREPIRRLPDATTLAEAIGEVTGYSEILDHSEPRLDRNHSTGAQTAILGSKGGSSPLAAKTQERADSPTDEVWLEDGVPFYQRADWSEPQFVDVGNAKATSVAIGPGFVAFSVASGEVHVIYENGLRRELRPEFEVGRVTYDGDGLLCRGQDGQRETFPVERAGA